MATSATTGQPTPASKSMREMIRKHPLFSFYFMAYAFSWVLSIPFILSEWGFLQGNWTLAFAVKAFAGPFLAAFIMTNIMEGKEGILHLRRRMVQWRAGWQWYLFILLAIPALFLLGMLVQPGVPASFQGLSTRFVIYYLVNFIIIFFLGGPLAEEPGWRGFALPRMQARYGALKGTLFLGVIWAFWHLPDFLTSAQGGGPGTGWATFFTNLPFFLLLVVSISIIMTWVYNHTRGSIFIAILLHASINSCQILPELFSVTNTPFFTLINIAMLIGTAVPALLILIFTRGRLGEAILE